MFCVPLALPSSLLWAGAAAGRTEGAEGSPYFPAGGASACSDTKGQQGFSVQCETGVLWREQHTARGCARVSLQGGRRGTQDKTSVLQGGWDQSPVPSSRGAGSPG